MLPAGQPALAAQPVLTQPGASFPQAPRSNSRGVFFWGAAMFKLKYSRGRESTTLMFVTASWGAVLFKYLVADLAILSVEFPSMSTGEFGTAVALILSIWLGREWIDKGRNHAH